VVGGERRTYDVQARSSARQRRRRHRTPASDPRCATAMERMAEATSPHALTQLSSGVAVFRRSGRSPLQLILIPAAVEPRGSGLPRTPTTDDSSVLDGCGAARKLPDSRTLPAWKAQAARSLSARSTSRRLARLVRCPYGRAVSSSPTPNLEGGVTYAVRQRHRSPRIWRGRLLTADPGPA